MNLAGKPLREIVAEYPAATQIFERFGIDLCAMGDAPLSEACARQRLSLEQLEEKLHGLGEPGGESVPGDASLMQVIQHIVRVHHRRVRQDLPALTRLAETLREKHSDTALVQLPDLLGNLHRDLLEHIGREEQVLFPFIARMEEEKRVEYPAGHACFSSLMHPIARVKRSHDTALETLEAMRGTAHGFDPPAQACTRHRALFAGLRRFAEDITRHIRLEEEVLFPRALSLEAELLARRVA